MGKMKVLFVLPDARVGGIERVRMTLIEQFVAHGIECRLALRRCRGELVDHARALAPVDELAPLGIHQFIPALAKLIRREKPTHVITAFSDVGFLVWIALRLARSNAKWVHSVDQTHSIVASRPGVSGRIRHWLENRMAGFVYRHVSTVVAVSRGLEAEVVDYYGIPLRRISTIYNPIVPPEALFRRTGRQSVDGRPYIIVSMGRLVRLKGLDVLISAMPYVRSSWRLDIWGEGPERASLESTILASGMQDLIRLRGYTADPYAVMRQADLFVSASRHEGLGNALVEALACQCQVVATDCPYGPGEILDGGKFGQLVPVDDPVALADAINRVFNDGHYVEPDLLLERASTFTRDASCTRWEALLRSL
jgi:glycosyltransferase involved in cell wall biosynthesis